VPGTVGKRTNIYFLLYTVTMPYVFKKIKDKILNWGKEPEIMEEKQKWIIKLKNKTIETQMIISFTAQ
jgi:hypothetical protein